MPQKKLRKKAPQFQPLISGGNVADFPVPDVFSISFIFSVYRRALSRLQRVARKALIAATGSLHFHLIYNYPRLRISDQPLAISLF